MYPYVPYVTRILLVWLVMIPAHISLVISAPAVGIRKTLKTNKQLSSQLSSSSASSVCAVYIQLEISVEFQTRFCFLFKRSYRDTHITKNVYLSDTCTLPFNLLLTQEIKSNYCPNVLVVFTPCLLPRVYIQLGGVSKSFLRTSF